jgi:hypothetical protein
MGPVAFGMHLSWILLLDIDFKQINRFASGLGNYRCIILCRKWFFFPNPIFWIPISALSHYCFVGISCRMPSAAEGCILILFSGTLYRPKNTQDPQSVGMPRSMRYASAPHKMLKFWACCRDPVRVGEGPWTIDTRMAFFFPFLFCFYFYFLCSAQVFLGGLRLHERP